MMKIVYNSLKLILLLFLISGSYFIIPLAAAQESQYQLEQAVILSRHGVRSPTKMTEVRVNLMNEITPYSWPTWPVKEGDMTPRGEQLMALMGAFYGDYFRSNGLLSEKPCPADGVISVYADVDQRTLLTGEVFLEGIAPQCKFKIHHQANLKKKDPIFHPVKMGICYSNGEQAKNAVEAGLGAPLEILSERYASSLALMGNVINFSASPYCEKIQKRGEKCHFATFISNEIRINKQGTDVTLNGPLDLSSRIAEIFLLQYAQGMTDVAWQRLSSEADWASLLSLYNVKFELKYKNAYIVRYTGTPLLEIIEAVLTHQRDAKKLPSVVSLPIQNRIFFISGHDNNIANIAGMLGLNWQLPNQPDNTPPDGGLVFELWRNKDNQQYFVSIKMFYQTMAQLRNKEKLNLKDNPAGMVTISIPDCNINDENKRCPLDIFQQKVDKALEPACKI